METKQEITVQLTKEDFSIIKNALMDAHKRTLRKARTADAEPIEQWYEEAADMINKCHMKMAQLELAL